MSSSPRLPAPTRENAAFAEMFGTYFKVGDLARCRALANGGYSREARALIGSCEDRRIETAEGRSIPIRVYRPRSPARGLLVYFHGGGFVMGGLNTSDNVCCLITQLANCITVSVDYRLAPEHPFPAGVDDAFAAVQWSLAHEQSLGAKSGGVAVGGDSAGGTLANVACLMSRDRGLRLPNFQLLFYPGININLHTPERIAAAESDAILTRPMFAWLATLYGSNPEARQNPYCAPVFAEDLSSLPPALIIVGTCDPLRAENADYARRLWRAGVQVTYREYSGAVHGFVSGFESIPSGRAALEGGAISLREAFRA